LTPPIGAGVFEVRIRTSREHRLHHDVSADLGFAPREAEHLRLRAELMVEIQKLIEARGLTQTRAAQLFHVTQPRVSNLVRGRIDLFGIDTLADMLGRAGMSVRFVLSAGRRRKIA
jgi:predicted XRE-type DNA-binding protein